jgi:phosphate transport system substrate-binding protein
MNRFRVRVLLCELVVAITLLPWQASAGAVAASRHDQVTVHLRGAGSTFDDPFFQLAFAAYQRQHPVTISYSAVGSGAGTTQFSRGLVDFGATDVPMNGSELALAVLKDGGVEQVPIALGGVAIVFHLPGLSHRLRLDGGTLAAIFLGKVTRWRDPAIASTNPGLNLPDLPIVPIHRSDSSGTTYITTDYLSTVSPPWLAKVGRGKLLTWPTHGAGNGNPGVAVAVQAAMGTIGYVELSYALARNLTIAAIQNQAGSYVLPNMSTISAAAMQFPVVDASQFSIVNAGGAGSYPIAGYSWALLRRHPKMNEAALVALFRWMATTGQQYAAQVQYVPLTAQVQALALQILSHID